MTNNDGGIETWQLAIWHVQVFYSP